MVLLCQTLHTRLYDRERNMGNFALENAYFYDAKAENSKLEESEIKRLIQDCMSAQKCYIE